MLKLALEIFAEGIFAVEIFAEGIFAERIFRLTEIQSNGNFVERNFHRRNLRRTEFSSKSSLKSSL